MATVDNLQIEISSQAKSASQAIDTLVSKLDVLVNSLSNVNTKGLQEFASGINLLSNGMKAMQSIKTPDFTRTANGIKKFEQIDGEKLSIVSSALTPLANGVNTISNLSFDNKNFQSLINSLTRLSNANIESLSNVDFTALGNSIKGLTDSLSNAEKVQQSTISITNAIANLAKNGGNISVVSTELPLLKDKLNEFISAMSNAANIEPNTILFTQAIASLANAGSKAGTTAGNLQNLGEELKKFMQTMSTAPTVNKNIVQMTQALANLASQGGKTGTAANSLQKNIVSLSGSMVGLKSSTLKAFKGLKSFSSQLLSSMGIYVGIFGLIKGIKSAIEISSDLTEVQNVVDNTFGDMTYKVEEFAQDSIKQLGMSELSVKQYASRFQAMGVAMGITAEQVGDANAYLARQTDGYVNMSDSLADVSLNLTKLTADMASFYNVAQEDVAKDLAAIFTGQTRPLRTYGLDLTQATLQEWAMKQGLDADISSMTQAEKTMLRYQYVLANTSAAHNDFARTSATWANQIRILKEQFVQLGGVVGTAFINMLKPLVTALNTAMGAVINFAETVVNALGVIFGWKLEITSGSLAQDFEDAAAGASDLASGTGKAADNAKKLKQQLQGFHELNVLTSPSDGGSGGGGGAGGIGGTGAAGGGAKFDIVETESAFKSQIDTLYKLGEYIGDTITKGLNDINWDEVYQGAKDFGTGLADFLNGLISPELFGAVGKTIAGSLNTAIYAALSFGENFDFDEFGLSIATGINDFFKAFDFKSLAKTLNTWAHGILSGLITAIGNTDWGEIGKKIGEFINEIDIGDLLLDFGELALNILVALGDAIKALYEENPLAGAIVTLLGGIVFTNKLNGLANNILNALGVSIGNASGSSVGSSLISSLSTFFNTPIAQASLKQIGVAIVAGLMLGELLSKELNNWVAAPLAEALGDKELASYYREYDGWVESTIGLIERAKDSEVGFGQEVKDAMGMWLYGDYYQTPQQMEQATQRLKNQAKLFGEESAKSLIKSSSYAKLLGIDLKDVGQDAQNAWEDIKNGKSPFASLKHVADSSLKSVKKSFENTYSNVEKKTKSFSNWFKGIIPNAVDKSAQDTEKSGESLSKTTDNIYRNIKDSISLNTETAKTNAINNFNGMKNGIVSIWGNANTAISGQTENMKNNSLKKISDLSISSQNTMSKMASSIIGSASYMSQGTSTQSELLKNNLINNIGLASSSAQGTASMMANNVVGSLAYMNSNSAVQGEALRKNVTDKISQTSNSAQSLASQMANGVIGSASYMLSTISGQDWYTPGVNLVEGLKNGINYNWNNSGGKSLVSKVISLAKTLTTNLKNAFGIHSPSKIWSDEIGVMLTRGLGVGISNGKGQLLTETSSLANSMNTSFFENLELAGNPFDEMQASMTSTSARLSSDINGTARIESGNLSNDIANGITSGMSMSQAEQNALLREQNELLRQLLSKDIGISSNDIFESVKRSNRQEFNRKGTNPLVY